MENQLSLSYCSWKGEKAEVMSRLTADSPWRLILVPMPLGNLCNFSWRLSSCDESWILRGGRESAAINTLLKENNLMNGFWIDLFKEVSVKPTRFLMCHSFQVLNIDGLWVIWRTLKKEKTHIQWHIEGMLPVCGRETYPMSLLGQGEPPEGAGCRAEMNLAKSKFVQLLCGLPYMQTDAGVVSKVQMVIMSLKVHQMEGCFSLELS